MGKSGRQRGERDRAFGGQEQRYVAARQSVVHLATCFEEAAAPVAEVFAEVRLTRSLERANQARLGAEALAYQEGELLRAARGGGGPLGGAAA
jgi:hypothetical protein